MITFDFYEVAPAHQKYFYDEGVELDSWTDARQYAEELGDEWQCSVRVCERGREETEVIGPERALRAKIHNDNKKRIRNLMRAEREAMKRNKQEIKT